MYSWWISKDKRLAKCNRCGYEVIVKKSSITGRLLFGAFCVMCNERTAHRVAVRGEDGEACELEEVEDFG